MKSKTFYLSLFSILLIYSSCSKISENLEQDIIVYDTVYFDIPVLSSVTATVAIPAVKPTLNLEEQLKNSPNNFTTSNIKATKMTSLNMALGLIGPKKDSIDVNNNFGNLETVKFAFSPDGKTANIANLTIVSTAKSGALGLTPIISPDSLKPYLTDQSTNYYIRVKAKAVTTTVMKVRAAATYTVKLAR
uniref:hypothetical protein n=1 Tax=Pedobacter schmidteae TaxID=2201271 RepID=UPI000EB2C5CB|nr:hypothetical protein [Pedobacter schmidteae]